MIASGAHNRAIKRGKPIVGSWRAAYELGLFAGVKARIAERVRQWRAMGVSPVGPSGRTKMSAWFNLKLFGPAALALGISTVSLWPERASADVVFDFNSGPCNLTGCPANTDMATGVLRLTDDYVYGDEVTPATFISMSYSSGDLTLDITNREALDFLGGSIRTAHLMHRGEFHF